MATSLFLPIRFKTTIQISPRELQDDIDGVILMKLKTMYEGICSRFGYIKKGSLEVMKRSIGVCVKQHFNGHFRYETVCRAEVCNPPMQSIVTAIVKNKNALGVHAESTVVIEGQETPVLDILIPRRTAGIISEVDLDTMQSGDRIFIQILNKKYQLYDRHIEIIGRAVASPTSTTSNNKDEVVITDGDKEDAPEQEDLYDEDSDHDASDDSSSEKDSDNEEDLEDELEGSTKKIVLSDEEEEDVEEEIEEEEELPEEDEHVDDEDEYKSDGGYDYV